MLIRITFLLLIVFTIPFAARAAVIQLPRTGQTNCWDISGTPIDCAGTGADGETLKGILWPSPRFIDNDDGTLTDKLTDLVWLKDTDYFKRRITWQEALDFSNTLADGAHGLTDGSRAGQWRLPNRKELLSLANYNVPDGGVWLDSQGFSNGQHNYYWSSDTCLAYATAYKWTVHSVGAAYPDNWTAPSVGSHFVIPVRNVLTPAVTVTGAITGTHGSISSTNPLTTAVNSAVALTLAADAGYRPNSTVTGTCPAGSFSGNTYYIGTITADCSVSFSFNPITYTINTSTSGSGSIACTPAGPVSYNTAASCTATPATGNHITCVTVDGQNKVIDDPNTLTYPFGTVTADHTISAAFAVNSYTVTFTPGSNGTLTGGASQQTVNYGGSTSAVTALPSTGYHLVNWTGDYGFATTEDNPLTVANVTASQTVTANFTAATHTVTPRTAANGHLTPATPQTVSYNGLTSFTVTPDAGYRIASVTGCGGLLNSATYTTGPITADCSVNFSFTPIIYTIITTTSGSGSIACTPAGPLSYNTAASCTATPASGNHITGVTVDDQNKAIGDPNTYTYPFVAVTTDHTISVAFAVNSYTVTFTPGSNGTLTGDASQTVDYGGSTGAVTALPSTGYHLVNWTGDNGFATTTDNPLTVANVTASQVVTANFSADTHTVAPGTAANGRLTSATPQTVSYNDVTSFTVTPDTGYRIASVTGCGGLLNSATYTTGPITADCSVNFSFTPITYTINTSTSGSGGIACTPAGPLSYNTAASCTATPASGNHITRVTVDGQNKAIGDPNTLNYPFGAVTANHTISVAFAANSYTVTFIPGSNGTLTGSAGQTVNYDGSTSAVSALPSTGYHLVNWTGDNGFATTTDNPLTVANVTASRTVTANFSADTHTVTPGTAANGRLTPATPQTVSYNGVTSFTVTPDTGYRIASVTGCGGLLNSATYTTGPITADCSISATFAADPPATYAISGTFPDGNGAISCTSAVTPGGTATCTITLQPGFQLAALTDNGTDSLALVSNNIYTITNVTGNHTVAATFTANTYTIEEILQEYKSVEGKVQLPGSEKTRCDIAPLGVDGKPRPDGTVDVADLIIMLRKLVGVISW